MVTQIFNDTFLPVNETHKALLETSSGDNVPEVYGLRLLKCLKANDPYSVGMLTSHGADVNFQDRHGMTALHHAAARGSRSCIRVLVNSGKCDYLIKDKENRYAFEIAIEWTKDYAVGRLLAKKQKEQSIKQSVPAWAKLSNGS